MSSTPSTIVQKPFFRPFAIALLTGLAGTLGAGQHRTTDLPTLSTSQFIDRS